MQSIFTWRILCSIITLGSKYGSPGLTDDRLINASQNNLRSYVTVNRPMANSTRPRSCTGTKEVPTTTPVSRSFISNSAGNKRVRLTESETSNQNSISRTPPLPPISPKTRQNRGPLKNRPEPPPPRVIIKRVTNPQHSHQRGHITTEIDDNRQQKRKK